MRIAVQQRELEVPRYPSPTAFVQTVHYTPRRNFIQLKTPHGRKKSRCKSDPERFLNHTDAQLISRIPLEQPSISLLRYSYDADPTHPSLPYCKQIITGPLKKGRVYAEIIM
jgi:hypothetical protein